MENDSIRASGSHTLVDIWINGKLRAINVSREAIETFLGFDRTPGMSDEDRCEFVRTHLPLIVTAVKASLREANSAAETVVIEGGQLPRPDGPAGDRRKTERRKAERRKVDRPKGDLPLGERRRSDRRKASRRRSPSKRG